MKRSAARVKRRCSACLKRCEARLKRFQRRFEACPKCCEALVKRFQRRFEACLKRYEARLTCCETLRNTLRVPASSSGDRGPASVCVRKPLRRAWTGERASAATTSTGRLLL